MEPLSNTSLPPFPSLASLRRAWPEDVPFVGLGGGDFVIVATSFRELPAEPALARRLPEGTEHRELPFTSGLIGILSYDHYRHGAESGAPLRIFRVDRALVIDRVNQRMVHTGQESHAVNPVEVTDEMLSAVIAKANALVPAGDHEGLELEPESDDAAYRSLVQQALEDIRNGRYYQINLLRYFSLRLVPDVETLAARVDALGGDFAAWIDVPKLMLVSFSPERFVRIQVRQGQREIETFPVKGTTPRGLDGDEDQRLMEALRASPKDRAELAMIVDLMRNDLSRVSIEGTVTVPDPLRVLTTPTVHHLEARVAAKPMRGLTLGQLLHNLCPGGSITGAPKREVMEAIRAYEGRDRGYFMGNAFYLDDHGGFDSSILIRTLVKVPGKPLEFAAGSGIVMASDPETERLEIDAKARVVTAPLTPRHERG